MLGYILIVMLVYRLSYMTEAIRKLDKNMMKI